MSLDDHDTAGDRATQDAIRRAMTPPGLDAGVRERLLSRAEAELKSRRRGPRVWRVGGGIAVAATLLLGVGVTLVLVRGQARSASPPSLERLAGDVNHDGVLDILDAHALARSVERGDAGEDLDGDGVATLADADWIADRVVRLGEAG